MKTRILGMLAMAVAASGLVWLTPTPAHAQAAKGKSNYKAPRWDDGKTANLQGIWVVDGLDTSRYSLEAHSAATGIRAGLGVITDPADGMIPYKPEARAKQKENFNSRFTADPLGKCYMTGVPRFVTSGFAFQIFQTPRYIIMASEYTHMLRYIFMDRKEHRYDGDLEFWLGDSIGRWEGDTLVVDAWNHLADTWLDLSGNHHSTKMKVQERFTRTGENTMTYTATITDPEVLTRPYTISVKLVRNPDPNAVLFEYECHSYAEDDANLRSGQ